MQVGPYEVLEEIARGGFGAVYRARDVRLGREVALKVLLEVSDQAEVERFLREGQAAARVKHPNVVRVHGQGQDAEGRPYLVLDFVPGPTLTERIEASGSLPLADAGALIATLARCLEAAHEAGVLHRDLKPDNVLFEGERPLVTDFGIAKLAGRRSLTQTGEVLGTPSYMAPEQVAGERSGLGPATDVYGLGGLLYFVLTGQPPFREGSLLATLDKVANAAPRAPSTHRADGDRSLDAICLRALGKDPGERYPRALDLALALEAWGEEGAPAGRSRLPWVVLVLLVALGVGVLGGGLAIQASSPGPTASPGDNVRSPRPTPEPATPSPSLPGATQGELLLAEGRELASQDLAKAKRVLRRAARHPEVAQAALLEQALIFVRERDLKAAREAIGRLSEDAFRSPEEQARLAYVTGRCVGLSGHPLRARALLEQAASLAPECAEYVAWVGLSLPAGQAGEILARAEALDPKDPAVVWLAINQNRSREQVEGDYARLKAALALAPVSPELAISEPHFLWLLGERKAAITLADTRMQEWPRHPRAYRNAGWFAAQHSRDRQLDGQTREAWLRRAETILNEGVKRFPAQAGLLLEQAWVLQRRARYADSLAAHQRLLKLNPGPEALGNTYLAVRTWLGAACRLRVVAGLDDPLRVARVGLDALDQLEARYSKALAGTAYGKTPQALREARATLKAYAGRVLGIKRRFGEAARALGPEVSGGARKKLARYFNYLNMVERSQLTLGESRTGLLLESKALLLEGFPIGVAEALESRLSLGAPVGSEKALEWARKLDPRAALRVKLVRVVQQRPYRLQDEVAVRQEICRGEPGNLLAWLRLFDLLIQHGQFAQLAGIFDGAPEALRAEPLAILRGAQAIAGGKTTPQRLAGAERHYRGLLDQAPDFSVARAKLIEFLVRNGRPQEARDQLSVLKSQGFGDSVLGEIESQVRAAEAALEAR